VRQATVTAFDYVTQKLVSRSQTVFTVFACVGGKIKTDKSGLATRDYTKTATCTRE